MNYLITGMEPRFGMGLLPHDLMSGRVMSRPQGMHHLQTGKFQFEIQNLIDFLIFT